MPALRQARHRAGELGRGQGRERGSLGHLAGQRLQQHQGSQAGGTPQQLAAGEARGCGSRRRVRGIAGCHPVRTLRTSPPSDPDHSQRTPPDRAVNGVVTRERRATVQPSVRPIRSGHPARSGGVHPGSTGERERRVWGPDADLNRCSGVLHPLRLRPSRLPDPPLRHAWSVLRARPSVARKALE